MVSEAKPMLGGRCVHCGEAVGVYEPAVWATDDGRLVVSSPLAVDPRELLPSVAAHLHLECWNKLTGRPSRSPVP
jgi:hypothetical protein